MITDEMIAEAAAELNEAMINSLPNPDECKHQFSKKFERQMEKLIFRVNHPIRYKVLSRVACIFLVILLGFTVVMSCSPTVRAAVFEWVKKAYESFYSYYFDAEVEERTNIYYIDSLPEGFVEITNTDDGGTHLYIYTNKQNELLVFTYSLNPDLSVFYMEKDGYLVKEIIVDGKRADLYISQDENLTNGIIWYNEEDGFIFYISGPLDREELAKIAESVRKK